MVKCDTYCMYSGLQIKSTNFYTRTKTHPDAYIKVFQESSLIQQIKKGLIMGHAVVA